MTPEQDARYLRYVVARLSAYRNVWWSMANEFDILKSKTDEDWDRLFQVVRDADPHSRLRSIHNWRRYYDNGRSVGDPLQHQERMSRARRRAGRDRSVWKKAVVFDEVCYEGNLDERWGDLTGQEMVRPSGTVWSAGPTSAIRMLPQAGRNGRRLLAGRGRRTARRAGRVWPS